MKCGHLNFLLSNYQIVLQLLQGGVWSSDRYNGQKQLRLLALIVLVEAWWMIEDNSDMMVWIIAVVQMTNGLQIVNLRKGCVFTLSSAIISQV